MRFLILLVLPLLGCALFQPVTVECGSYDGRLPSVGCIDPRTGRYRGNVVGWEGGYATTETGTEGRRRPAIVHCSGDTCVVY